MAGRDDLDWLYGQGDDDSGAGADSAFGSGGDRSAVRPPRSREVPPVDPYVRPAPAPPAAGTAPHGDHSAYGSAGPAPARPRDPYARNTQPPAPPAPPPPPPHARQRRRRRRRGRRPVLRTIIGAFLAYLLVFPAIAWFGSASVDATPEGDRPGRQPGITLLLAGSDSREGLDEDERKEFGTGKVEGHRADTIMLLHVPVIGAPMLVSVPRDSYVEIPGYGPNKVNAAYALGGSQLLAETLEQETGVRIDGFTEIGFGGFVNIIDAVGGVEMCLDAPMQDDDAHIDLEAGCQELTGAEALGYVRMRKSDPRGDIGRAERQREMVGSTVKRVLSPLTLVNPVRWISINMAVRDAITRGRDTGLIDAGSLVYGAGTIGVGVGHTLSVPAAQTDAQTSAGSSVIWDEEESERVFRAMRRGNTLGIGEIAAAEEEGGN